MVSVKICGLRTVKDALKCVEFGADAIGLLVGPNHTSPDTVDDARAAEIIASLPPHILSVLIFHTSDHSFIVDTVRKLRAKAVTLHESTVLDDIAPLKASMPDVQIYKSVYVTGPAVIHEAQRWLATPIDALHLDSANLNSKKFGGTGQLHDWALSAAIVTASPKPVMMAGGLNPDNVGDAVRAVRPSMVDVNTGTRGADGFRDYAKLEAFIKNAKMAG